MAVNWPGLVSIGVFYIIVLGTGIWASRKSKREEKKCSGNRSEVAMVGGRNLNIYVSIFTMTATWVGGGYIMGSAEMVYNPTKGLVWAVAPLAFSMNLIIGGLFFVKPIRSKNYVTLMDPFSGEIRQQSVPLCSSFPLSLGTSCGLHVFWVYWVMGAVWSYLPGLPDDLLTTLIDELGVESVEDLALMEEKDLVRYLKLIQCRKLLNGIKQGFVTINMEVRSPHPIASSSANTLASPQAFRPPHHLLSSPPSSTPSTSSSANTLASPQAFRPPHHLLSSPPSASNSSQSP
ncbi:hypothetical protein JOQ06_026038 [Pogonophryne albipinna]|uniref:High-affinity choline transporter 1-like n=1 Tax=Pogonophryne albipinna TaxID=1090488 RepID=A0AAD6AA55_9TELE|nr:hypothetical protein JOQ06_026038 [Pogonophryne albipinna]